MRRISVPVFAGALVAGVLGFVATPVEAAQTCAGVKATIVGTQKNDKIQGTKGRDVIVGLGGNDTISGGGGNDIICGGEGADVISGNDGNDKLYGEADAYAVDSRGLYSRRGDLLTGGEGDDLMDLGADSRPVPKDGTLVPDGVSYGNAPAPLVISARTSPAIVTTNGTDTIVFNAQIRIVGTPFADSIHGSDGPDYIYGRGGDDQIWGHGGDDHITADGSTSTPGNDVVNGGPGADRISSHIGYDTLAGGSGGDTITSTSTSRLAISGGPGPDLVSILLPAEADFSFNGGAGRNELRLGAFPDYTLRPTLRLDMAKGKAALSGIQPVKYLGKVKKFSKVTFPAYTRTIYRGTNKGDVIEAHRDWGIKAITRGGADVITGSNTKDKIDGGKGFDIAYAKGGKDKCKAVERRHSC